MIFLDPIDTVECNRKNSNLLEDSKGVTKMNEKLDNQLHIRVYMHNASMSFPCCLCGTGHQQDLSAAELMDGDKRVMKSLSDVCPECLYAGPEGAAKRTREFIRYLREKAIALELLAAEIETLTLDKWATRADLEAASKAALDPSNWEYASDGTKVNSNG
jgi:hypothetical protein